MLPGKPTNNLLLFSGEKNPLTGAAPSNIYGNYVAAPTGSYTFIVKREADGTVVARVPVVLPDNGFVTLLVTEKNGQLAAELINDTPDPKAAQTDNSPRLVLRQFFPGAVVKITASGGQPSRSAAYGEMATLENLPAIAGVSLKLDAVLPTTPPTSQTWTVSGDFSVARRATMLLVADSYGRLRPQLCYDGPPSAGATPKP